MKNGQTEKKSEDGKGMSAAEITEFEKPLLETYEKEGSPYFATARLWDDGFIQVEDTRKVLGQALRVVSKGYCERDEKKGGAYGVFRMYILVLL